MTVLPAIVQAARAFERGDLGSAETACRGILAGDPRNADALHLLGLVRRKQGAAAEAEPLLNASIEIAPQRAEWRVNYANLLRSIGRLRDAEFQLRTALSLAPQSRPARLGLARLLIDAGLPAQAETEIKPLLARNPEDAEALATLAGAQRALGQLDEAESSYRSALAIRPDYAAARHNLGALLCELQRSEEALEELERAGALGLATPELHYNRGSALFALARFDEADGALMSAIRLFPEHLDSQVLLAKMRFMRGEDDYTRDLEQAAAGAADPRLVMTLGDLLRRGGHFERAADILRGIAGRQAGSPQVASSLAVVLQEQGELKEALRYARTAVEGARDDPDMTENLVAILLQLGDPEQCEPMIRHWRQREPADQRWLAYEATAARLAGGPRYEELYDFERFVQAFDLQPPRGYLSIEDFHAELVPHLIDLHRLDTHPLDQSLRHGTQTPRDLRADTHHTIRGFIEALAEPITAYRDKLGFDPHHPFLRRNRGEYQLAGCWSVRLQRGGYHVNHIHSKGWISSAYYVEVPAEVDDDEQRSGWIKFGEPRMETPGAGPVRFEKPRPGRLVLFPSYMWHGTMPIHEDEPRMTIAFDVVTAS